MLKTYFNKFFLLPGILACAVLLATGAFGQGTAITPTSGYTNAFRFQYSGANQTFTVPTGVTQIFVKIWGAGGGGSNANGFYSIGGAGGYVSATVPVTPGAVYSVLVGGGGFSDGNTSWATHAYGFGGISNGQSLGSDGGGLSGLFTGNTAVAATDMVRAVMVAGGGGGGEDGTAAGTLQANGGQGGDATFGGGQPTMAGGNCTTAVGFGTGGGGGGGYEGGVAMQLRLSNSATVTMGEGGSNFLAPTVTGGISNATADRGKQFTSSAFNFPPNTGDPQYVAGVGVGTNITSSVGGNGLVIIQYSTPPLPITLISFSASAIDDHVRLGWTTANEINFYGFRIERSTDAVNFISISGDIAASVTSHAYSYLDPTPASGNNYYRLKMMDRSGNFRYSQVVRVSFSGHPASDIRLYLNPAGSILTFSGLSNGMRIKIMSADGRVVQQQETTGSAINIAGLPAGLYYVEVLQQDHIAVSLRFIKQ